MKNILLSAVAFMALVSTAFGQVTFGPPKAPKSGEFSTSSVGGEVDTSLLKLVTFFDNLDSSYFAINYDVGQADNLLSNPVRVGFAGAIKGDKQYWFGPALGYDLVNNTKVSFGIIFGFPTLDVRDSKLVWTDNAKVIPGLRFSARF